MAWNMKKNRPKPGTYQPPGAVDFRIAEIEARIGKLAEKAATEDGSIDLGKLTGPEACAYMAALGVPLGGRY